MTFHFLTFFAGKEKGGKKKDGGKGKGKKGKKGSSDDSLPKILPVCPTIRCFYTACNYIEVNSFP